jgi:hypothetical protein
MIRRDGGDLRLLRRRPATFEATLPSGRAGRPAEAPRRRLTTPEDGGGFDPFRDQRRGDHYDERR